MGKLINIVGEENTNNGEADLAAMNGTAWIAALETANTQFATTYSQRVNTATANNNIPSFTVVRKVSKALFDEMLVMLSSRYNTAKADKEDLTNYEACIAELNTLINNANILAVNSIVHRVAKTDTNKPA